MASYKVSYNRTIFGNEGAYNPGIGEKETYMGVDRGANPNWPGWYVIDIYKRDNPHASVQKLNVLLGTNLNLQASIYSFYKANYWDTVNLDNVNDQQVANNLFDCSVNQGEGMARRFIQVACNEVIEKLNSKVSPLVIDRKIGAATLNAVNSLPAADLMNGINDLRLASYKQDSGYAEWGKVWAKRLTSYT